MSGKPKRGKNISPKQVKRALVRGFTVFGFGIALAASLRQLNWWIVGAVLLATLVATLFDRPRARRGQLRYLLPLAAAVAVILFICGVGLWRPLGVDRPIELKPLCQQFGGIVAPPTERNAAFHYHCVGSNEPITRTQIKQRCKDQWGLSAKLVLRNPDSAAGWKCHVGGLIS